MRVPRGAGAAAAVRQAREGQRLSLLCVAAARAPCASAPIPPARATWCADRPRDVWVPLSGRRGAGSGQESERSLGLRD